jgi:hypothetical protein
MEIGYILEMWRSTYLPTLWIEGEPESSSWTMTKTKGKKEEAGSMLPMSGMRPPGVVRDRGMDRKVPNLIDYRRAQLRTLSR